MNRKRWIKAVPYISVVVGPLLGLYVITKNEGHKKPYFEAQRQKFEQHVRGYEQAYGQFHTKPKLVFMWLPRYHLGSAGCQGIVIVKDNPLSAKPIEFKNYSIDDIVSHELGHQVTFDILKEANSGFMKCLPNGTIEYDKSMKNQMHTILEGSAEYITIRRGSKAATAYSDYLKFVSPVLYKLGIREGFKLMLVNPPTDDELKNPSAYYTRIRI